MDDVAQFQAEMWSLYTVAVLFITLRLAARWRTVGFIGLQGDDYVIAITLIFYTALTVIAHTGGTLYYGSERPERHPAPPPDHPNYSIWVSGAQLHIASWFMYASTLWLLKLSLLFLYLRLTAGLSGGYRTRTMLGFSLMIFTYLAVILTVFLGCRPFHYYWRSVPPPQNHCQAAVSRPIVITAYTTNVFTDLYLMSIPLPMLWNTSMPTWKKLGLGFLFTGGFVVIIFTTIRCVIIITNPTRGAPLSGTWAVRESFVAIVTTNLPMVFTLVKGMLGPRFRTAQPGASALDDKAGMPLDTLDRRKENCSRRCRGSFAPNPTVTNMIFSQSEERMVNGQDSPPLSRPRTPAELEAEDSMEKEIERPKMPIVEMYAGPRSPRAPYELDAADNELHVKYPV
ncbi:hypothetical protein S40285_04659 [Stachybotrys chlorohalonatus IBT 40285]|uniref:Rhodopsin domain-containing protein n=1 Tax=Stachybotrys chlorohalonatus (strain IBT 40285) TaxID=1283841 RepID=A0A084QPG3_STAC4|nr:hypothetical protein S40285_04659 [Stachybotrys chlorohalonata IBT 40285]